MLEEKLVRAREQRRWTINEAARHAGLHRFALQKLENGTTEPSKVSVTTAVSLCTLYAGEVFLEDFVGWSLAKKNRLRLQSHRSKPQ